MRLLADLSRKGADPLSTVVSVNLPFQLPGCVCPEQGFNLLTLHPLLSRPSCDVCDVRDMWIVGCTLQYEGVSLFDTTDHSRGFLL